MRNTYAMNAIDRLVEAPIVPTVLPLPADLFCAYLRALSTEGFPAVEILCRPIEPALQLMQAIARRPERKEVLVGLGTVRSAADAVRAVAVKPDFIVSPAFSRNVLQTAKRAGIPYLPGVSSFQDVQDVCDAYDEEKIPLKALKLVPVESMSRQYLDYLAGCFPGILYLPSGDPFIETRASTYLSWKSLPFIAAPMGANFIPRAWLEKGDMAKVRARLRALRALAEKAELKKGIP